MINNNMNDLKHKKFKHMESNPFNKGQWYRLRKWDTEQKQKGVNRNLAYALNELEKISDKLEVTDKVKIDSVKVYTDSVEHEILKGRSVETIIYSSIYISCRLNRLPFSAGDISSLCNIKVKQLLGTSKLICKECDIKLPLMSAKDYIPRYCELLNVSDTVMDRAITLCDEADDEGLVNGKAPTTVAAASIYLSSVIMGQKVTQRSVADVVGVSDVAIRKLCKVLKEGLSLPI